LAVTTREAELHQIMADLITLEVMTDGPEPPTSEEQLDIRRELEELKARLRRLMQ
jgi:hypothetical protein